MAVFDSCQHCDRMCLDGMYCASYTELLMFYQTCPVDL